jgi:hypothetical protein
VDNGTVIHQTAVFDPVGLTGLLYWYVIYPFHQWVFRGMLREIGKKARMLEKPFPVPLPG